MAHYYCLLMDVDGTLLDFKAAERAAIRATFEHYNLQATEEHIDAYHRINEELWAALERGEVRQEKLVVQRFARLLEQLGTSGDAVKMNDYYLTQLSQGADLLPGADEALRELSEVATIAIVTNGVEQVQLGRLERSGIGAYCDGVFVSSRVGASKPARRIFDVALDTMGIEQRKRVLVVGDSLKADIGGGNAAGLDTCWCNFDDAPLPENAPKPTFVIRGYEELLRIVMEEEELERVGSKEKRHQI